MLVKKWIIIIACVMIALVGCQATENSSLSESTKETAVSKTTETVISTTEKSITIEDDITGEQMVENKIDSEDEYIALISQFKSQNTISTSQKEKLKILANTVLINRVLERDASIVFQEMTGPDKGLLQHGIISDVMYGTYEHLGYKLSSQYVESGYLFEKDEIFTLFEDLFGQGFAQIEWGNTSFKNYSDDQIMVVFGDGEPWVYADNCEMWENDTHYLLSAPCFYGDNGSLDERFVYYADFLFEKNTTNALGATMVYATCYQEEKIIQEMKATSTLEPGNDATYEAMNVIDGDYTTAWVEGVDGVGEGEELVITFKEKTKVNGIQIYNGYQKNADIYAKNGIVSRVRIISDDGTQIERDIQVYDAEIVSYYLGDGCAIGRISWDEPVYTKQIRIVITGAIAGTKYEDTCISEIQVY